MTDDNNSVEVNIMGKQYHVACPAGHELELSEAVNYLNNRLEEMAHQDLPYSRDNLAVITALNLSYDLLKLQNTMAREATKAHQLIERIKTSCNRFDIQQPNKIEKTFGVSL